MTSLTNYLEISLIKVGIAFLLFLLAFGVGKLTYFM